MTSVVGLGPKQTGGYYIPLANVADKILAWTAGTGAGGSYQSGSFAVAPWAAFGSSASPYTSSISTIGAGGILRDEGKTVVSAGRVFRKIQLLCSTGSVSTAGVAGAAPGSTTANTDYLTGYIERPSGAINGLGGNGLSHLGNVPQVAFIPALY
jgi:hypothetical protein